MNVTLDSNAYSAYMDGNRRVRDILLEADTIFLSVIVIGEQLFGFMRGNRFEHNRILLESFINQPYVQVIEIGMETANYYGRIHTSLRAKGRPIPTNDIWIAAHAMEYGAALVTADSDFDHVDGLTVIPVVG